MRYEGKQIPPEMVLESVKPKETAMLDAWGMGGMKGAKPIGEKEIAKAVEILTRYKAGKANLEARIVEDELWWEMRHWEAIGRKNTARNAAVRGPEPASGWLFNAIMNKHADAMDNYPEPVVLPRERSDEESAKVLSSVLPVILEYNSFEQTYSDNWWEKLKHGTAVYGQFWNPEKENGLGDIDIKGIDLLKIFWEPGITDIQKSRNLFIVELVDEDLLDAKYPEHAGKMGGGVIDVAQYCYDDAVDTSEKSVVVDWYYRAVNAMGKTVVHLVKFVGDVILYASQNDPEYAERGWYDHGEYPVVFDVLFPEKGTPVGFGYVSICKDPQMYIDKLSQHIMENAMMTTKKRFFISENTDVNEEEFLDWNKPLVHVAGELDERRIKEIVCQPLSSIYLEIMQMKIEEMKDTSSNRDVNSGGTGSGVTAAAAIAALQEAGNKTSRDMIAGSYRAYNNIDRQAIELARQFYDETRAFRITGDMGNYEFVDFSNAGIRDQPIGTDSMGQTLFRKPIFDIKIKAQKKNPFSRMEQNERAKELFSMGFFNPEMAQQAMGALDMMEFEGIDKVREKVMEGQTLLNIVQQMNQQMTQMAMIIQSITGQDMGIGVQPNGGQPGAPAPKSGGKTPVTDAAMQAQTPMTGYGQRLAARSKPDMNMGAMT